VLATLIGGAEVSGTGIGIVTIQRIVPDTFAIEAVVPRGAGIVVFAGATFRGVQATVFIVADILCTGIAVIA